MKNYLLNYFEEDFIDLVLCAKKYTRLIKQQSDIDMNLCKTLYINYNLPIYKIAMLYGVSDVTMRTYLINNNVELKGHKCGKNSQNNYFETIDTPDKAYYLGLFIADGWLKDKSTLTKEKKEVGIELTQEDKYILERFNTYGHFNAKIITTHKTDKKPRERLCINSCKVYDDLYNLNLRPNKSTINTTSIPNISEDLMHHLVRGIFDGDGIAKESGYVGFCGSQLLMTQIRDWLALKGLKNNKVSFNKDNNIYYVQWASKKDRQLFFDIIYDNKLDLYLTRKYDKIKNKL